MNKQFTTANNWPQPEKKVGGGRHVWHLTAKPIGQIPGGFKVDLSAFPRGSVFPAGSPIKYNEATRTAEAHIAVSVYETAAIGATSVKVKKNLGNTVVHSGINLIPAPSAIDGTAAAITVTAVDTSNHDYDELTVAALEAALTEGTILIEADKAGAGAEIKVVPNALTRYDIYADATSTQEWATAVIEGMVFERRISPVAAPVKKLLTEITFSQSR